MFCPYILVFDIIFDFNVSNIDFFYLIAKLINQHKNTFAPSKFVLNDDLPCKAT